MCELLKIIIDYYLLVESSRKSLWCEEVVIYSNNKENFWKLVSEIKYWCDVASKVLAKSYPNEFKEDVSYSINISTWDDIEEDVGNLCKRLKRAIEREIGDSQTMAKHLLQRINVSKRFELGEEEDALKSILYKDNYEVIEDTSLGEGGFRNVFKANWLGIQCAIKILKS